jgi:trehalose 6-phosphate phosphatase
MFSGAAMQRLADVVRDRMLCAFDFDGTLAPIMPRPEKVRLPDGTRDMLVRLSSHAPVAIITGRSLEDVRGRLGFQPDFIVGNHGMEGVPGWEEQAAEHARHCAAWKSQLEHMLGRSPDASGIWVEDKRYSLSVHFRMSPDPEKASALLGVMLPRLEPRPRLVTGKYVINVVDEDAYHKGSALEALMHACGAGSAMYAGDDVTDEDVFRMKRAEVLTVRVEHNSDSAADFFVPHADDMLRLLEELTTRLRAAGARNWVKDVAAAGAE